MDTACNHVNTHYEEAPEFSHNYEVCDDCDAFREVDKEHGLPFGNFGWAE